MMRIIAAIALYCSLLIGFTDPGRQMDAILLCTLFPRNLTHDVAGYSRKTLSAIRRSDRKSRAALQISHLTTGFYRSTINMTYG